jgi:Zn-dependent protease with chaperone function
MDPEHAAIGVTRGLLQKLNREERQGVIGHEMGHVLNMDTRYMTAVAIMVGLIALVCDAARRMMWYGGAMGGGRRRDRDEKGGGNIILLVIFIVLAILAPIAAQLVRFAVSRQREYLADATSVRLTRNPVGLIGALEKLAAEQRPFDGANRATQHMLSIRSRSSAPTRRRCSRPTRRSSSASSDCRISACCRDSHTAANPPQANAVERPSEASHYHGCLILPLKRAH